MRLEATTALLLLLLFVRACVDAQGFGGLLPPCFPFLWVHLQGLTHLPHILDMEKIPVIAGPG